MSDTLRQSMTYGTMPTFEDFETAFNAECPDGYRIVLSQSDSRATDEFQLGDGTWNARELYNACAEIAGATADTPEGTLEFWARYDTAMDLVSSIMDTLGFEWI